jgi:hypothetical protein
MIIRRYHTNRKYRRGASNIRRPDRTNATLWCQVGPFEAISKRYGFKPFRYLTFRDALALSQARRIGTVGIEQGRGAATEIARVVFRW